MAIELKFTKSDNTTPWGFRLVGGVDYEQPLVVVKVIENSIAEKIGLCLGDIIVRVNDTPTAGLTHSEAHDLIHSAGIDFIFGIRRGAFTDIVIPCQEEDYENIEFEAILNENLAVEQTNILNQQAQQEPNATKPSRTKEDQNPPGLENLAGQEKVLNIKSSGREKKWSTFLQKPKQPVPQCKKMQEERKIVGEPYRVKIVKQPKKSPEERKVKFQPTVTEVEYTSDQKTEVSGITTEHQLQNNFELEVELSATEIEETQIEVLEMDEPEQETCDNEEAEEIRATPDEELTLTIEQPVSKTKPIENIQIDSVKESSLSLEEQLAAVQKQLLALSRLPSAIQVTLEAVTEQLNQIVKAKMNGDDEENGEAFTEEDNINGEDSSSERAEADITENENENVASDSELRDEERKVNSENLEYDEQSRETINEEDHQEQEEKKHDEGPTEEEREVMIMEELRKMQEEELKAKKQKEMEEEQRKRDWVTRPILLPGGRKWTDPDDAVPKLRTPKMTDEKICSTIDSFSEVIVGKTKGGSNCFSVPSKVMHGNKPVQIEETEGNMSLRLVDRVICNRCLEESQCPNGRKNLTLFTLKRINFLKFEPPARNLNYLQKSEVYRMIHNMEPSVSGIGTRAEKILSEEDYYSNKGAP